MLKSKSRFDRGDLLVVPILLLFLAAYIIGTSSLVYDVFWGDHANSIRFQIKKNG